MELLKSISKTVKFYAKFEQKRLINKYTNKQLGAWCKDELILMGPSFIKIGQFVSTRSDVFSKEITDELKELQDNVTPVPWSELKDKINIIDYDNINEIPIASASIGQVHLATINNKKVVIKIKRPNIDKLIKADFQGLLTFIKFMKRFSDDRRLNEFEILFTEYYKLLEEEVDFIKEANNMVQFKSMFKDKPWITIPTLYKEYSNKDYITMEYIPSTKIDDIVTLKGKNFDVEKISIKLIECYVDQIIKYGLIHIDPHPGNLGITDSGKMVFYDYGMVLELDPLIKNKFDDLLIALYDKDIDKITKITLDMELIVVEKQNLPYLKKFLLFFLSYIETVNIDTFKISYLDTINKSDTPFLISSKFLLLLRGISILEGNCKVLDPTFNYTKTLNPYINDYLIDIRYIENKTRMDIKTLTSFPTKMKEQQIEMDIMKMNLKQENISKEETFKKKAIFIGTVLIFSSVISQEINNQFVAAILSAIILF